MPSVTIGGMRRPMLTRTTVNVKGPGVQIAPFVVLALNLYRCTIVDAADQRRQSTTTATQAGGHGRRREARGRLAPDRLARDQRQHRRCGRRRASASSRRCACSTTGRTRWRARSRPAGRGRSASSGSTRRSTGRPRRSSASTAPRTRTGTSSAPSSLRTLDRASVLEAVERLRIQGVEGILVIAPQTEAAHAVLQLPDDLPVVAVEAGPETRRSACRRRSGGRRDRGDPASARARPPDRLAHRGPGGLVRGASARRRLASRRCARLGSSRRRRSSATGARVRATSSARASRPTPT